MASFPRSHAAARSALFFLAFFLQPFEAQSAPSALKADQTRAPREESGQRWLPVQLDRPLLLASAQKGGRLALPALAGLPPEARFERMERRPDGQVVWIGKVDTRFGEQSVVLTAGRDATFGLIPGRDGGARRLESLHGQAWLAETAAGASLPTPVGADFVLPPEPSAARREWRRRQDLQKVLPEPVVDVLVVYTGNLVSVWGSDDAVRTRITHLEAISNQAYADSGAEVRIRVVAMHLVDYSLRNDNSDALDDIRAPSSLPIKLEVDRLRDQYGADLVALLRSQDRSAQTSCGIASLIGYHGDAFDPDMGFSVTADRGFGGDGCSEWTFTHEIGHNMGAHHDTETTEGDYGAYPHSRGHRQTLGADAGFATIMGYTTGPQVRLGRFSTPLLDHCLGQPCGIANEADNARGIGDSATAMANLRSPPAGAMPRLLVSDAVITEGNSGFSTMDFTVSLSEPAAAPVTFDLATQNGTAASGGDYTALALADRSIAPGQTSLVVQVSVRGDTLVERDEYFSLNVRDLQGALVADSQGVGRIINDETLPVLSVSDARVVEGDTGTVAAVFTASLDRPSTSAVSFNVNAHAFAADTHSATEEVDFNDPALVGLSIPAGQTRLQFSVPVLGDAAAEADEIFFITLKYPTGATLADGWGVGQVLDDDGGDADAPRLFLSDVAVVEGQAGAASARVLLELTRPATSDVGYAISTLDRSASAGSDYVARALADQVIPAGQTRAHFDVEVRGDARVEPEEIFWVRVSAVTGARVLDARANITIVNDDRTPPALAARDDRFVLRENVPPAALDVLANDVHDPSRLSVGQLSLLSQPRGSASVLDNGTADAADDRIRYVPPANAAGADEFRYRACDGDGGCSEARVQVELRPAVDPRLTAAGAAGFQDLELSGLRALPSAGFAATALVAPEPATLVLPGDPSPEDAWDASRLGTGLVVRGLPADAGGQPQEWRVLVDASGLAGRDVDLYLGVDLDGNGQPSPGELRCTAAMANAERCELALTHPGTGELRYWAMAHNRAGEPQQATLELFEVPLRPGDAGFVATGPGRLGAAETFALRLAWTEHGLLPGESRAGYVRVRNAGQDIGLFPVRIDHEGGATAAIALASGQARSLRLAPGASHERSFIDVPAGATRLEVTSTSAQDVDLYLARAATPSAPRVGDAPPRDQAHAVAATSSGNEQLVVEGAALAPGRWYLTPVNRGTGAADVALLATVTGTAPPVRSGSFYNAERAGHGLFLYPAGSQLAGLWYTYFQDGTPTWYYLQGAQPGANGLWRAQLYRSAWNGTGNQLTAIGEATLAPTGADAFRFTYTLDGETGSEPMAALGRGCPSLDGQPLDVSSHWFNPARAGAGYSVQMFPNYEFLAAFVYDGRGVPRFLLAERNGFGGASASLPLVQLSGFCPLCDREAAPGRVEVGELGRAFDASGFTRMQLDAIFAQGLPGAWTADEAIQPLGGAATVQGCETP